MKTLQSFEQFALQKNEIRNLSVAGGEGTGSIPSSHGTGGSTNRAGGTDTGGGEGGGGTGGGSKGPGITPWAEHGG